MGKGFKIKWKPEKFNRALEKYEDRLLRKTAIEYKGLVTILAPIKTGALKKSIDIKKKGKLRYRIKSNLPYAIFLEFGTRFMAPRPFFRRALTVLKTKAKMIWK